MSGRRWSIGGAVVAAALLVAWLLGRHGDEVDDVGGTVRTDAGRDDVDAFVQPSTAPVSAPPGLAPAPAEPPPESVEGPAFGGERFGIVIGPDGRPVEGTRVRFVSKEPGPLLPGERDLFPGGAPVAANGRFLFFEREVRGRWIRAEALSGRYAPASADGDALTDGDLVLRLGPPTRVRVRIVAEEGEMSGEGTVAWRPAEGDTDGEAEHATPVPAGREADLVLEVGHDGPVVVTVTDAAYYAEPGHVRLEAPSGDVTFRLRPWTALTLRLRDDATGQPVRARARVTIGSRQDPGRETWGFQNWERQWTDASGGLQFAQLREGLHVVHLEAEGFEPWKDERVVLERGRGLPVLDVRLRRDARFGALELLVRGHDRSESHRSWTLLARGPGTDGWWRSQPAAVVSADRLRVEALAPGDYDVMAWSPRGQVGSVQRARVVGGAVSEERMDLGPGVVVAMTEEPSLDATTRASLRGDGAVVVEVRAAGLGRLPHVWFEDRGYTVADGDVPAAHALGPFPFDRVDVAWRTAPDAAPVTTSVGR